MYKAKLTATVTEKRNKDIFTTWKVMELKYNVKDNILWIIDYRGHIIDFDLDVFDVKIKSDEEENREESETALYNKLERD